ncbi:CHAD domain-containing protein [Pseudomonas sp. 5P_3.1_Bac2]|uniref:CHAD domain-containing protein n=1 Tax=Pseudomonas sp. 5P_3.1_Bac2 TaxID=2971617 RepID=UPI0021CAD6BD|nr:CHAD domain-containing protein [Pseudomonas sp. 5P_3.1_Bac2]MCU1716964.1 CHAD domain-containing protein [Pseudomonas sp. 5P_3.1_Bac2]
MSALTQQVQRHVLRLHIRLLACRERLAAGTDQRALHDLRVAVRQLRNLLRPLPAYSGAEALTSAAAQLGRTSGGLRDLEVLDGFLRRHGDSASRAAQARQTQLAQGYQQLLQGMALAELLRALDAWPQQWRAANATGELAGVARRVRRRLAKDEQRLLLALHDPEHDWHDLRLLVKRLRYGLDAYPEQGRVLVVQYPQLKQAQTALGKWHDCWQWLQRATSDEDLQPWVNQWQGALGRGEQRVAKVLTQLRQAWPHVV